uniref:Uncharacterized protein n=1 Tax=Peronospora matthiolae TaxID=2874970 RepID=A0AAV1TPA3_9STRA
MTWNESGRGKSGEIGAFGGRGCEVSHMTTQFPTRETT